MSHLAKCLRMCSANCHADLTTVCVLSGGSADIIAQIRSAVDELNMNVRDNFFKHVTVSIMQSG